MTLMKKNQYALFIIALASSFTACATTTAVIAQHNHKTIEGSVTKTVVYEDFESGYADMPISHEEEHWGDRVIRTSGETHIVSNDTDSHARYEFSGQFDHVNLLDDWEDSDAGFYFRVDTNTAPGDADGIAITLKTDNFAAVYLSLKQSSGNNQEDFWIRFLTNPGELRDYKIPFDLFIPGEPGYVLKKNKKVQIELYINFIENYNMFYFRDGTEIRGAIDVDNIGLYSQTIPASANVIASFDDEVDRALVASDIYGSSLYTDYEISDKGISVINPYVTGQEIFLSRESGGPSDTYFNARVELEA
jgi:hypothetical protein